MRQVRLGIRSFAVTTRAASMLPPQAADWAQLIYATQGSLTVECPTGERLWYVPAHRALWIPAGAICRLRMRGTVRLRMLYLHESTKLDYSEGSLKWDTMWDITEELLEHLEKHHEGTDVEHLIAVLNGLR